MSIGNAVPSTGLPEEVVTCLNNARFVSSAVYENSIQAYPSNQFPHAAPSGNLEQ